MSGSSEHPVMKYLIRLSFEVEGVVE